MQRALFKIRWAAMMAFFVLIAIVSLFGLSACDSNVYIRMSDYNFRIENGYLVWDSARVHGSDLRYSVYVMSGTEDDPLERALKDAGDRGIRYACCCYVDGMGLWNLQKVRSYTLPRVYLGGLNIGWGGSIRVVSRRHRNVSSVGFFSFFVQDTYTVVDYDIEILPNFMLRINSDDARYRVGISHSGHGGWISFLSIGFGGNGAVNFRNRFNFDMLRLNAIAVERLTYRYAYIEYDDNGNRVLHLNRRRGVLEFESVIEDRELEFGVEAAEWYDSWSSVMRHRLLLDFSDRRFVYDDTRFYYNVRHINGCDGADVSYGFVGNVGGMRDFVNYINLPTMHCRVGTNTLRFSGINGWEYSDGVLIFIREVGEWSYEMRAFEGEAMVVVGGRQGVGIITDFVQTAPMMIDMMGLGLAVFWLEGF